MKNFGRKQPDETEYWVLRSMRPYRNEICEESPPAKESYFDEEEFLDIVGAVA